ncbi:hypothetical protein PILCRDRAFT_9965, partial [Piloderma croceum F 1598]
MTTVTLKRILAAHHDLPSTPTQYTLSSLLHPLTLLLPTPFLPFLPPSLDPSSDIHLLGQHTIHMSPISTAHLNPYAHTFCLSPETNGGVVLVPILLNNTEVGNVRYTLTPLGDGDGGKVEYVELGARELKAIEVARVESLSIARPGSVGSTNNLPQNNDDDEYDEYDDDPSSPSSPSDTKPTTDSADQHHLQKTQSITHIRLKKTGTIRLERVLDVSSNTAARLAHPLEVTVVPCPKAEFLADRVESVRCAGAGAGTDSKEGTGTDLKFMIDIKGVPPLSLRWFKEVNGRREHFLVEGIESGHRHPQPADDTQAAPELPLVVNTRKKSKVPRELKVPLEVSLDAVGRHTYVLEEIIDGFGNAVYLDHHHPPSSSSSSHKLPFLFHDPNTTTNHPNTKTTRTLSVLRRPSISFKHCGPGSPTPLLIGSEAPLTIAVNEAAGDEMDAPWDVEVVYRPFGGGDGEGEGEGK